MDELKKPSFTDEDLVGEAESAEADGAFRRRVRRVEDFRYDERQDAYWDTTTGTLLKPTAVNSAVALKDWPTRLTAKGEVVPLEPSKAIARVETRLTVEGSTWWCGLPKFIEDHVVTGRGAEFLRGAITYNTYIPPDHSRAKNNQTPKRWIDHVKMLFPDPTEHEHFFDFAAHMVQRPHEKVNHGLVVAGGQGIGKDTALLPLRRGVGEHNTAEVGPEAITAKFNGHAQSVLLIVNEVRPHHEEHKASTFYNQLKPLLASPPEMLPIERKFMDVVYIRNLCHVILTTNDPLTMYIPEEDRRLFVMVSPLPDPKLNDVFPEGYFRDIHAYLADGGSDAAIKWLKCRDISGVDFGSPPPMTIGKESIIQSAHEVRRSSVDDIMEAYFDHKDFKNDPHFLHVVFPTDLIRFAETSDLFDDVKLVIAALKSKSLGFKLDSMGYAMVKHRYASEFKTAKFRSRVAFVAKSVPPSERVELAMAALAARS